MEIGNLGSNIAIIQVRKIAVGSSKGGEEKYQILEQHFSALTLPMIWAR